MEKYDVTVDKCGTVRFYKPGTKESHRLDGPANEYANGEKYWYQDGKLHRLDGPAIERANGEKYWYINGEYYSEKEFKAKVAVVEASAKEYTIAEISDLLGYEVKIVRG